VEAELMELWSAVEKERAESGEASGDSPEAAADGPDGTERGETGGTSHERVKPERVNGKKRGMYAVVRQMLTEMKGLRKGPRVPSLRDRAVAGVLQPGHVLHLGHQLRAAGVGESRGSLRLRRGAPGVRGIAV
jgi:hypothetical protein